MCAAPTRLIHRRDEFRGAPHTLSEIKKLENKGKISVKTPCQLDSIEGDKEIKSITIKYDDGKTDKRVMFNDIELISLKNPRIFLFLEMTSAKTDKTIEIGNFNFSIMNALNLRNIFDIADKLLDLLQEAKNKLGDKFQHFDFHPDNMFVKFNKNVGTIKSNESGLVV